MPNIIAYTVLLSWPLVAFWLYSALPRTRAIICLVVVPYLLLPSATEIDLPAVPPINKTTWANLTLLVVVLMMSKEKISLIPRSRIAFLLLALLVVGPFITALQNGDPLLFPQGYVPGMSLYDALSGLIQSILMILPFLVARACLGTVEAHREILVVFVVSGLAYSLLMLIEIRLSPQLHNWIYGFYQHMFAQTVRSGGYRPMVFLYHGLLVTFFAMSAALASAALWRALKTTERPSALYLGAALYLLGLLFISNSLGSLLLGICFVPFVLVAGKRLQLAVAAMCALIAITYPALRGAELVPVEGIYEAARSISEDRALSLKFRFDSERDLLDRAAERPLFGWGNWGRNHIHDPVTGEETSITDGYWIIVIGMDGWIGFMAEFGLLCLPVFIIFMRYKDLDPSFITVGLCLILSINMIDLLPNASLTSLTWLLSGALLGLAEKRSSEMTPLADQEVVHVKSSRPRTIL